MPDRIGETDSPQELPRAAEKERATDPARAEHQNGVLSRTNRRKPLGRGGRENGMDHTGRRLQALDMALVKVKTAGEASTARIASSLLRSMLGRSGRALAEPTGSGGLPNRTTAC